MMSTTTAENMLKALGPIGLTFFLVVAAGYMIRVLPWVANRYIPIFIPFIGGLVMCLIAPADFVGPDWRHPDAVLFIYGFIVGVTAWAAHLLIIQRAEEWLRTRITAVDRFLSATEDKHVIANVKTSVVTDLLDGVKTETTETEVVSNKSTKQNEN